MALPLLSGLSRFWKWLLPFALLIAGGWWWASKPAEVQTTPVVQAFPSQSVSVLNATGYVVAGRKASLSSKATGRLEWLGVTEGSAVKAGTLVARLESRDLLASLEQSKAQVGVAKAELADAELAFKRSEQLLARQFISSSSHDSAVARRNKAKAALASSEAAQRVAEANLAQTEIRAPFDGVVLTKSANVGDNITPFSSAADTKGAVVTMADMSTLEVEVDVSESNIGRLKIGQPAEIGLDALPGERFAGSIARMVPTIDRSKATRMVKVTFDAIDSRVLPDMSAKVVFLERQLAESERKPIVAVNAQAVVVRDGKSWVYVVDANQQVKLIDIGAPAVPTSAASAAGAANAPLVPVANLKPGDRVVIRPADLRDGQRVKIVAP